MNHGQGEPGCTCDYSVSYGDDTEDCPCCGVLEGMPCVKREAPSHTVVSPTKDEKFYEPLDRPMTKGWDQTILICTQHIPCCWGKGLRTSHQHCKDTKEFSTKTCACHAGQP